MSVITRMRNQTAVYWGPSTNDGDGGLSWPEPVEIACRWDDSQQARKDEHSNEVVEGAKVYVDREVFVDGYLYDGSLSSVSGQDPDVVVGARRIVRVDKTPNFKATETLITVTVL